MISEGSIVFGRCKFQKAGCQGRATCTSVGDGALSTIICQISEHNHLPDQWAQSSARSVIK